MARRRAERARASALAAVLALVVLVAGAVVLGCAGAAEARRPARAVTEGDAKAVAAKPGDAKRVETGEASYYGAKFNGRRTASGERYDPRRLTAAHRSLPLGTRIRVTRTSGGADGPSVEVRVNDRCGCTHGRIVDLSHAAARRLHMLSSGVVPVRIDVLR